MDFSPSLNPQQLNPSKIGNEFVPASDYLSSPEFSPPPSTSQLFIKDEKKQDKQHLTRLSEKKAMHH